MTPQSLHRHTPPRDGRVSTRRVFSPRREEELARKRREWMKRQEALKRHNLLQKLCAEQYARELRRLEEQEHRREHRRRPSRSRSRSRDRTVRFRSRSREPRPPSSREIDRLASYSHRSTMYRVHMSSSPRRPEERSQLSRQGREPPYPSNRSHRDESSDLYQRRERSKPESNRTDSRYSRRRYLEDLRPGSSRTRSQLPPLGFCDCGSNYNHCTCPLGIERRRRDSTGPSHGRYRQESGNRNRTSSRNQYQGNRGNRRHGSQQEPEPSPSTSQQQSAQFQALPPQNPDVAHQPLQQQQPGVNVNPPQQQSGQQLPNYPTPPLNPLQDPSMTQIIIAQQTIRTQIGGEFYNWYNTSERDPKLCPIKLPFQAKEWNWDKYLSSIRDENGLIKLELVNLGLNTFWKPVPPDSYLPLNQADRGRGRGHRFGRGRGRGYPRGRGRGRGYPRGRG